MGGILFCRRRKNETDSISGVNQVIYENQKVSVFEIKRKLKAMKNDIRVIRIIGCESDRDRFESLEILLLREDLQVSDFPRIQKITIDFIKKAVNEAKDDEI